MTVLARKKLRARMAAPSPRRNCETRRFEPKTVPLCIRLRCAGVCDECGQTQAKIHCPTTCYGFRCDACCPECGGAQLAVQIARGGGVR
jgi:hypothetical protein